MDLKQKEFFILTLAWFITFPVALVRMVYSITIIPVTVYFHTNYFISSLILSMFYIGYAFANLPFGHLVDRYGYRIIALNLFLLGILMFAFSESINYVEAMVLMLAMGIVSAPTFTGALKLVSSKNSSFRATAIGILNTVAPVSLLLSNFIIPSLLEKINWQILYAYISIVTVAISIPVFFLESPAVKSGKSAINRKSIFASVIRFFAFWGMWGSSSFLFLLVHEHFHLSLIQTGIISGIFSMGAVMAVLTGGYISDMVKKRKEISAIFLFLFFLFLIIYPFLPVNYIYYFTFLLGFLAFGYKTPLDTYIAEITKGKEATSMGLANTISQPSSIVVPAMVGYLITYTGNIPLAFVSLSIGPLIALILMKKLD